MNPKSLIGPTIRPIERVRIHRADGSEVWHAVTPTRFACALPLVQNPVRAREDRKRADRTLKVIDPYGTPQLGAKREPYRASSADGQPG